MILCPKFIAWIQTQNFKEQEYWQSYFKPIAKDLYGPFSVHVGVYEMNPKRKPRLERSLISGRKLRPW